MDTRTDSTSVPDGEAASAASTPPDETPSPIPGCTVQEQLGKGGMTRVHLADERGTAGVPEPVVVDLGERYRFRRSGKRTIVRTRDPAELGVFTAAYFVASRLEEPPEPLDCDDIFLLARSRVRAEKP